MVGQPPPPPMSIENTKKPEPASTCKEDYTYVVFDRCLCFTVRKRPTDDEIRAGNTKGKLKARQVAKVLKCTHKLPEV